MSVQKVEVKDYKKVAAVLAEAFYNDPVHLYFAGPPNGEQYERLLQDCFEYIAYACLMRGHVFQVDDFSGVALWAGPGERIDDWYTVLRSGLWRLFYKLGAENRHRFFNELIPLHNRVMPEAMKDRIDNFWYLMFVGVKANSRGKGYLRKLLKPILDIADQRNLPCYLESTHPNNRPRYEHFGFRVVQTVQLKQDSDIIPIDVMVREP
ncbi:hypothetical protein SPOG_03580 [Schizosaccharomyces cryophilus OY26]|uniref:N-acetyltransferase domain-containing protein n=1 Tax=Schizosaccharomyces cryophilus (strain OY26 / ATCC MYA-4695 / CBS 11777 / NBRC 106824 / NRRL Y48691) TaxID=653667 RepID=S9WZG8_SCHCR|nr:uncharacterized protein SPOG_03580 [Schizosaccharomyces cryophilus OY26]EPY50112.1 hypothetical protein SPOG_03580 [Schizosaccharomyces cryophilus OY26]